MNHRKINRFWQSTTLFLAPPLIVLLIWFRPSMNVYQFYANAREYFTSKRE